MKETKEDFSFFEEEDKGLDNFVDKSMEIVDRINVLLVASELSKKELAKKMNKSQSEISKWLNGVHNFTIKTLSKLEVALGDSIFLPCEGEEFLKVKNKSLNVIVLNNVEFLSPISKEMPLISQETIRHNFVVFPLKLEESTDTSEGIVNEEKALYYHKLHKQQVTFNNIVINE